jgi:hypothetical protein
MAGAITGFFTALLASILIQYLLFGLFFKPPKFPKLFVSIARPFVSITSPIASLFLFKWGYGIIEPTLGMGCPYPVEEIFIFFSCFVSTGVITSILLYFSDAFSIDFKGTTIRVFAFSFMCPLILFGFSIFFRM